MKKSKLVSFFRVVFLLLIFSAFSTSAWGGTLYLKTGGWQTNNARFSAYFFGSGETWVSMTKVSDGVYSCEAPSGYPSVIFCRMNGATTGNDWGNKWEQTGDLTVPTDGKNLYDRSNSSWSVYSAGTDDPVKTLPTSKGNCERIEIYSKDNYNLYVFKDSHIGPDWGSTQKGESVTYNGSSYYKWTICDNEYVHIIFQNGDRSKQSGDSPKLYGGYAYIFDGEYVSDSRPVPNPSSFEEVNCSATGSCYNSSSSDDEEDDYIDALKCDPANTKIIFTETFGTFTNNDDRTSYSRTLASHGYVARVGSNYSAMATKCTAIKDAGKYAVLANPKWAGCGTQSNGDTHACECNDSWWYLNMEDHTTGDTNGGMLMFNCNDGTNTTDILYECELEVCAETYINFSAFIAPANALRDCNAYQDAGVKFILKDKNSGEQIAAKTIKNIKLNAGWQDVSVMFNAGEADNATDNKKEVVLQFINVAVDGNCGNDLLIDDITLSVCTPQAVLETSNGTSTSTILLGKTETLTTEITSGLMDDPYYLWQVSDTRTGTWINLTDGAVQNKATYTVTPDSPNLQYRVIIAPSLEDITKGLANVNTNNDVCGMYAITNVATVTSKALALAVSAPDNQICVDGEDYTTIEISVTNPLGTKVTGVTVNIDNLADFTATKTSGAGTYSAGVWTIGDIAAGATQTLKLKLTSTKSITASSSRFLQYYVKTVSGISYSSYTDAPDDSKKQTQVTLNPLPDALFSVNKETICDGSTTSEIAIKVNKGTPNYTLTVDGKDYSTSTVPYILKVTPSTTKTYTLTQVKDSKGCIYKPTQNNTATVTVEKLSITTQPTTQTVCVGGKATFKVVAEGANKYTWEVSKDNKTWELIADASTTSSTYTTPAVTADDNGKYYRVNVCKDGGKCGIITSNSAELIVTTIDKPTLLNNGKYDECSTTGDISLSTLFSGTALKYYSDSELKSEITTGTFSASEIVKDKPYYATQTINGCTSEAAVATVTVKQLPTLTSVVTNKYAICGTETDSKATLTYNITGGKSPYGLTIQRIEGNSTSTTTTEVKLVSPGTYDVKPSSDATYKFIKVSDSNGCYSENEDGLVEDITIDVQNIILLENLANRIACADKTLDYTIKASGDNLNYQWYESIDNGVTFNRVGTNSSSYSTNAFTITDKKQYKVEVYQSPEVCSAIKSKESVVTVTDCSRLSLGYGLESQSATVCMGEEIKFKYTLTNSSDAANITVNITNIANQTLKGTANASLGEYDHEKGVWEVGKIAKDAEATLEITIVGSTAVKDTVSTVYVSKAGTTEYTIDNTIAISTQTITVKNITRAPALIAETYKACPESGMLDLETQISSDKTNLKFYTSETGTTYVTQASKSEEGTTTYWVSNKLDEECESPRTQLDIVVYPQPTAKLTGDKTICNGEPAYLAIKLSGTPKYTVTYAANVDGTETDKTLNKISDSEISVPVYPTETTTYSLKEVKDGNNCSATLSGGATVTVNYPPTINGIPKELSVVYVCDGDVLPLPTLTITENGSTITSTKWYFNGKEYKEGDKVEYNDDVDGVELKLEYEATNDCGSTKVDAGKYIIKPRPTIESFEITDEDNIICEGASTTLSVQFKGEAPFTFYINEEEYQTNNATWTTTISQAGTYTITALSDNYCAAESSAEKEVALIVEELPVVTLDATEVTLNCAKQTATITASGASTYEWSYVDESGVTQKKTGATLDVKQTNKEVPTLVTEYSVYGYSEKAGCKSENAVTVEVTEDFVLPKVNMTTYNFGMDVDLEKDLILTCNHYAVQLFADAANSPVEVANYEWSTGEKGEDYSIITAKSAATYFVDITAVNGCKITDSIKVTENFKTPDISLTSYRIAKNERVESTVLTCTYQTLNLEATINNPEEIGVEDVYLYWSIDGRDFAGPNPLEISEEGVYTVFIQGDNYCKGDTSIVITAAQDHPVLTLTSSADEINCYTPSIDLEVESDIDSVSYDWIKWLQVSPDGSKEGEMVTGDSIATIDKGGYYEVIVTVDSTGCASSEKITIAENTRKPIINSLISSTTLDKTIEGYKETKIVNCEDTELFIQSTVVDSIQVGYRPEELEYEWTVSYDKGDIFEEYGKSETISTKEEAIFRLVVTDKESGCSAVADSIHIKENKTTPTITAMTSVSTIDPSAEKVEETNVLTCEYPVLYLKPTITSENEFSYKWDDGSTENYREVKEEGTYSLVVTDNTSFCSTEEYKYSVTEDNDKPTLSVDTIYYLCPSDTLSITKLSSLLPKANGFIYKFYDESETEIEDLYEVPSESSATKYFVAGISDNGCISDTLSFSVDYAKNVDFTLTTSQTSMLVGGNETVVTIVPDADSEILDAYTWLVNGNEVDVDGLEHSSNLYIDTKFEVTATNRCDSDTKEAFVEVLWPTAFTPHNDNGKNEDFAKGMYIIVFNRFYTKIFEGPDGWDGTINGTMNESEQIAVPGVYYYSVKLPNGEVKKGTIEIIKID